MDDPENYKKSTPGRKRNRMMWMVNKPQIVREYEELNKESTNFNADEIEELKEFALNNTHDNQGNYRPGAGMAQRQVKDAKLCRHHSNQKE